MISYEQAAKMAIAKANAAFGYPTKMDEIVILHGHVKERPYGWFFVYNTRSSVETGDILKGLLGNGAILVLKDGSLVEQFSSGFSVEEAIRRFEARSKTK